ncbi:MAG: helix-turn-helix domain-containing protein [Acidobacteriaceae bacterium]|nr:helix-turn-helix domain-containing protein [Acidobacteriaceae bacterium]
MKRRYGDVIVHSLGLDTAPLLTTHSLRGPQIASTHVVCSSKQIGLAAPVRTEDTFITTVILSDIPYHELWSKGRPFAAGRFTANSMWASNLTREFRIRVFYPYEAVSFYIPRTSLDLLAKEEGLCRVENLSCQPGIIDPITASLARTLLPTFDHPRETSRFFVDQIMLAFGCHLLEQYGDAVRVSPARMRGGLSPAQVCRAKEMLASNLNGDLLVADIAQECDISRQRFIREFRKATGCTPLQWLQQSRVDRAKDMLKNTSLPIGKIALQCGFTDTRHFEKVFASLAGTAPAAWRQQIRGWIH